MWFSSMISLSLFLDLNVFLLHILVACIADKMLLSLLHKSLFFLSDCFFSDPELQILNQILDLGHPVQNYVSCQNTCVDSCFLFGINFWRTTLVTMPNCVASQNACLLKVRLTHSMTIYESMYMH